MKTNEIEFPPGTHIDAAIQRALRAAKIAGHPIQGTFNGCPVVAKPGQNPIEIKVAWQRSMDAAQEAWESSPEGQSFYRDQKFRQEQVERETEAALDEFVSVDLSNVKEVVRWLDRVVDNSYLAKSIKYRGLIIGELKRAGYKRNDCLGAKPEEGDRFGRYLVGQALDGLSQSPYAIHQMFTVFKERWENA